MPKILHLATDEKFIESANWIYEKAFPKANTFLIIIPETKNYQLKYVEKKPNFQFYITNKKTRQKISKAVKSSDIIVLHGYDFFKAKIVNSNPNATFVWTLWGEEVYNYYNVLRKEQFGKKTKKILDSKFKKMLLSLRNVYRYKSIDFKKYQNKSQKNIAYISILHKEDYNLFVKKNIINPQKTKHIEFTYYPIEFIFKNTENMLAEGDNILLGNSASHSNNHIEAIDILKNLDLEKRKVITPLSYGNKKYANYIINYGNKALQNNFEALTEFIALEEYNKKLQSCSIVIMNSYRQQSVGNIISALWMGAKVFLDNRNTIYHYFKRIGCNVFLIDQLSNKNLTMLSTEQIKQNREALFNQISTKKVVDTLRRDIDLIVKENQF